MKFIDWGPGSMDIDELVGLFRTPSQWKQKTAKSTFRKTSWQVARLEPRLRREGRTWAGVHGASPTEEERALILDRLAAGEALFRRALELGLDETPITASSARSLRSPHDSLRFRASCCTHTSEFAVKRSWPGRCEASVFGTVSRSNDYEVFWLRALIAESRESLGISD